MNISPTLVPHGSSLPFPRTFQVCWKSWISRWSMRVNTWSDTSYRKVLRTEATVEDAWVNHGEPHGFTALVWSVWFGCVLNLNNLSDLIACQVFFFSQLASVNDLWCWWEIILKNGHTARNLAKNTSISDQKRQMGLTISNLWGLTIHGSYMFPVYNSVYIYICICT